MTLGFGIKVALEIIVVLLIGYGIMNEEKLIAFEDELVPVLKFCYKKYIVSLKHKVRVKALSLGRKLYEQRNHTHTKSNKGAIG